MRPPATPVAQSADTESASECSGEFVRTDSFAAIEMEALPVTWRAGGDTEKRTTREPDVAQAAQPQVPVVGAGVHVIRPST